MQNSSLPEIRKTIVISAPIELKNLGDNQTEFTLIHAGFDAEKSTAFGQPHTVVRDIMNGGWEKIVKEKLTSFIASL